MVFDPVPELSRILAPDRVRTDEESLARYAVDWTRLHPPRAAAVVFPVTVAEVRGVVDLANAKGFALVPSGGRTGLSGGAVATRGEVVVSFDKMDAIREFDPVDRTVVCEAGVITESLQAFAAERDLFFPVDFASRGSSRIGGNVATNAGGVRVVRYGGFRDWVAGLKVVTGSGEVLDLNKGLVKNATGYDLRHLFIGSEGTLGFVVEATLRLARRPGATSVLLLAVPEAEGILRVFETFRSTFDPMAFEFFSGRALDHVVARGRGRRPFEAESAYYVLIELEQVTGDEPDVALDLMARAVERGWVADGTMSRSESQAKAMWRLREDLSETLAPLEPHKNDVAVTVSKVAAFMRELAAILEREYPRFEIVWYGHVGDGNLHINVLRPATMERESFVEHCRSVDERVFELVARYGGSISAEHGVGLTKRPYLHYTRSRAEIDLMRAIKRVFDPNGIMNPGKMI